MPAYFFKVSILRLGKRIWGSGVPAFGNKPLFEKRIFFDIQSFEFTGIKPKFIQNMKAAGMLDNMQLDSDYI